MSYGENFTTPCEACYQYVLPACPASDEEILIKGALGVELDRVWFVEDKFGHVTMGEATTDASGDLIIPVGDFPEGYFNEFSGEFTIYVKAEEADTDVLDLTFNSVEYKCIKLSFQANNSTNYTIA